MGLIRLILAVSVVRGHTGPILGLGLTDARFAVELFYMISGFYMALILTGRYAGKPVSLFYGNRVLRIYPVYLATVLLMLGLAVGNQLLNGSSSVLGPYLSSLGVVPRHDLFALALANLSIIGQDAALFMHVNAKGLVLNVPAQPAALPATNFMLLPQAWTISLELMFYALAPLLVRARTSRLIGLMALSVGFRLVMYAHGYDYDPFTYRFFPFELVFFLAGILCHRLYTRIEPLNISSWTAGFAWAATLALLVFYARLPEFGRSWILFGTVAVTLPIIFKRTKDLRLDRMLGEYSYPVYLNHVIVIGAIRRFVPASLLGDFTTVGALALSFLILKFVSAPVEAYRIRRVAARSRPLPHASVGESV